MEACFYSGVVIFFFVCVKSVSSPQFIGPNGSIARNYRIFYTTIGVSFSLPCYREYEVFVRLKYVWK